MEELQIRSIDGITLDACVHRSTKPISRGTVVQAHGISADMDEGGMFVRLADRLAEAGLSAVRFSFRGHGKSGGTQRGMTIAGEMLDLNAVIDYTVDQLPGRLAIVAASFGAVSACLSLPLIEHRVEALVLWNPVLDLQRTFVNPQTPWAMRNFSPRAVAALADTGYLLLDGAFQVGGVLYHEMRAHDPLAAFMSSGVPSLIIHGDADSYVPYSVAAEAADARGCDFFTITGSDHGFDGRQNEDTAIEETVRWLDVRFGSTR